MTGYRIAVLVSALCTALALASCGGDGARTGDAAGTDQRPPNVVVVLVDDLRWDDLGIEGHPFVETPAIDEVAREGARFRNAFATTPLCSPSRAAILTGQYAHSNGIVDNTARDSTSHQLQTFARPLVEAGYQTGFFGKWHMGNDDSPRPGWTRWVAMQGQGEANDPRFNVDGTRTQDSGYVTDLLTDRAVQFMEESRGKPFLVFLAHKALHPNMTQRADGSVVPVSGQGAGFIPAPRHRGRYATAIVPRRPNAGVPVVRKPALERHLPGVPPIATESGTPDQDVRDRLEMLLAVDESLARIIGTLKAMGEYDRTVVIVTSDHGYFYGEHRLNEERRLAYEETARIPLIVRYAPLVPARSTPTEMVQTIDLAPTILELARATDTVPRHGASLVPLLRGERVPWRTSVLIEYFSDKVFPRMQNMGYQAVRTERYKYIHYLELPGMDELYDLQADPFELDNIIDSEHGRAVLPTLQAELARLQEATGYRAAGRVR